MSNRRRAQKGWPGMPDMGASIGIKFRCGAARAAVIAVLIGNSADAATGLPLGHVADAPLGGHATRLDYESFDPGRHLLFIAHLGDSTVIVFDTQKRHVV